MSHRTYSLLVLKSVNDDQRIVEGLASTPEVDSMGDIVVPEGAEFKLPLPLLWQHNSREPIGEVFAAKVTPEGIQIKARIAKVSEPGKLKDRLDEAWQSIKAGLAKGFSIGFKALEFKPIESGLKFLKWLWVELSVVTIPANAEATIQVIKSVSSTTPGMTGTFARTSQVRSKAMTTAESIKSFTESRDQKTKEMTAMMTAASEKGETLDAEQSEKYDALKDEIEHINKHLERLEVLQQVVKASAKPVAGDNTENASASRAGRAQVITVSPNRPPGVGMARVAIAKAIAKMDGLSVTEVIEDRWPDDSAVRAFFRKAAVPAGITTNATWAGNLVDQTNLGSEFVEFLRPMTLVTRLPLRRVPFNIRITGQTTGAVANWVGEGRPKPVTSFSTNAQTLLYTKIAAIAVISQELARFSSPSAEMLVRDELARAVTERLDVDFIDPAHAAVANVNPASITNGVTALTSAGTSADNIRTDIQNLLEQFILNNQNAANVVLIMPNTLALAASMLVNSLGQPEFPGLGINGGTLAGLPVFTTQYAANQSGAGNLVIAVDTSAVLLADDGQVSIALSDQASIEMSDAPTNRSDTPTAASLVSMFQTDSIAFRAERFVNWLKARTTAVAYIDDANWGSIGSPS